MIHRTRRQVTNTAIFAAGEKARAENRGGTMWKEKRRKKCRRCKIVFVISCLFEFCSFFLHFLFVCHILSHFSVEFPFSFLRSTHSKANLHTWKMPLYIHFGSFDNAVHISPVSLKRHTYVYALCISKKSPQKKSNAKPKKWQSLRHSMRHSGYSTHSSFNIIQSYRCESIAGKYLKHKIF